MMKLYLFTRVIHRAQFRSFNEGILLTAPVATDGQGIRGHIRGRIQRLGELLRLVISYFFNLLTQLVLVYKEFGKVGFFL